MTKAVRSTGDELLWVCVHISAKNPFPLSFRIKNRVSLGLLFSRWHGDAAVYLWPGQQRLHISARHAGPASTPLQKSSRSLRGGAIRRLSLPRKRQFHSFLGHLLAPWPNRAQSPLLLIKGFPSQVRLRPGKENSSG